MRSLKCPGPAKRSVPMSNLKLIFANLLSHSLGNMLNFFTSFKLSGHSCLCCIGHTKISKQTALSTQKPVVSFTLEKYKRVNQE